MTEPWDNQKQEKEKRNVDKDPLVPLQNSAPPRLGALGGQATGTWHHPYHVPESTCGTLQAGTISQGSGMGRWILRQYQLGAMEDTGPARVGHWSWGLTVPDQSQLFP